MKHEIYDIPPTVIQSSYSEENSLDYTESYDECESANTSISFEPSPETKATLQATIITKNPSPPPPSPETGVLPPGVIIDNNHTPPPTPNNEVNIFIDLEAEPEVDLEAPPNYNLIYTRRLAYVLNFAASALSTAYFLGDYEELEVEQSLNMITAAASISALASNLYITREIIHNTDEEQRATETKTTILTTLTTLTLGTLTTITGHSIS